MSVVKFSQSGIIHNNINCCCIFYRFILNFHKRMNFHFNDMNINNVCRNV